MADDVPVCGIIRTLNRSSYNVPVGGTAFKAVRLVCFLSLHLVHYGDADIRLTHQNAHSIQMLERANPAPAPVMTRAVSVVLTQFGLHRIAHFVVAESLGIPGKSLSNWDALFTKWAQITSLAEALHFNALSKRAPSKGCGYWKACQRR